MNLNPTFHFTTATDVTVGPVSRADLEAAMRSPGWFPGALIWQEGWPEWMDWRSAATRIGIVDLPDLRFGAGNVAPSAMRQGRADTGGDSGNFYSPPAARLAAGPEGAAELARIIPAPFLKRFAAWFVDQILLNVAMTLVVLLLAFVAGALGPAPGTSEDPPLLFLIGYMIAVPALYLGYYVYFDTSRSGATLGKRMVAIRVTDLDGGRIGVGQSIVRTLSCGLSYVILYLGFLLALVTARKQALHDLIARTLVIERDPDTASGSEAATRAATITAVVVVVTMIAVAIIAILAAIAIPAYQDATRRSQVVSAIHETEPLRQSILEYRSVHGVCPEQGADGFGAPESYAGQYHEAVAFVRAPADEGLPVCTIRIVMGGSGSNNVRKVDTWGSLLLHLAPEGRYTCERETIDPRNLPMACRPVERR